MVPGRDRLPTEDEPEPEPIEVQLSRASLGQTGQHITLSLKPGASQVQSAFMTHSLLHYLRWTGHSSNLRLAAPRKFRNSSLMLLLLVSAVYA